MTTLAQATAPGKTEGTLVRANQSGPYAWILDGNLPAHSNSHTETQKFLTLIDEELEHQAANGGHETTRELLEAATTEISREHSFSHKVAASIAVFKATPSGTEYAVLGSIEIHGFLEGARVSIKDERIADTGAVLKARRQILDSRGELTEVEATTMSLNLAEIEKAAKNTEDGYWVLDGAAEALKHAIYGTLDGQRPVVAVTDDFASNRINPLMLAATPDKLSEQLDKATANRVDDVAAIISVPAGL